MIRITLIAAATLATIATASSALAQANAPVRTLNPSTMADASTISISERKAASCADKSCGSKRGPPLGW